LSGLATTEVERRRRDQRERKPSSRGSAGKTAFGGRSFLENFGRRFFIFLKRARKSFIIESTPAERADVERFLRAEIWERVVFLFLAR